MEYGKSNRYPKHDSDFMGAIFMCNNLTKKECFMRKLFGLPSAHSDFVKQIKTGMILFLFEPDERKLNGIFQATSDGAMNIVPGAFSISKKHFPAQVRFERVCSCRPLFEDEFGEAIEENYFTAIKFSFALSGRQVCRLISLFSSRSDLPYDQLPRGLQSEFKKIFENSGLAKTKVSGNGNLPNFDAARYNINNKIQPARNSLLLGRSRNHQTSCKNHEHNDITLQNHVVRGQHESFPSGYHSAKLQQRNQMLSTSCNDLSKEAIPAIPSSHPSHNSSRFPYQHPSVALGSDLLEQKLTLSNYQSYNSASQIWIKGFPFSNYPGIDASKSPSFSEPSQLALHSPEDHVNFHDFSRKGFHDNYSLPNNTFLHSSPERLQAIASTPLSLRNARSYSRSIQQESDSWNIQDWPSGSNYIPISGETLVNGYLPVLEGDLAYAKEAFDLPYRKHNVPLALQYDHHADTNSTDNYSFDFPHNDKSSVSDLNSFPQSNTFQKRCNVFHRLSRTPKKLKYSSFDHMVEAFYHQRSKATGKLEIPESDVPLDDIGEFQPFEIDSLVEKNPQIEEFDDGNGFSILDFKRRSVAKQRSSGKSDFTACVDKCKKRKIIRPSFSEEDNSSQVKENCPTDIKSSLNFRIEDIIPKIPIEESDGHSEGLGIVGHYLEPLPIILQDEPALSNTDSLTANIQSSQQILDCEKADGKPNDSLCPLPLDFIPLSVEKEDEAVDSSSVSTSDAEKAAAKTPAKNCLDSDMNHIVLKIEDSDFPLVIRCKTTPDLVREDSKITSDGFV